MYQFYLPVGDWSDDGHGQCVNYLVTSNRPVEDVREAHFKIKDTTGIDIEAVCCEYEDSELPDDVNDQLIDLGFPFEGESDWTYLSSRKMVQIWMFLLKKSSPGLELSLVEDETGIPMLPFYGFDEKGRHIGQVGYGVF